MNESVCERDEARDLLKNSKDKRLAAICSIGLCLGFPCQRFVTADIVQACDEVIFCVSEGYVPAGVCLASLLGNVAIKAFLTLTEHPSHQPMNISET